ncbi:phage head morphogenesis protein [Lactococcus garvieae]|nr:phage head morphogenesis protein [Lactococcus garvieae]
MKTPDYWIKREQAWQAQQIKDDTKRMNQIRDKLFESQEAIQKEINANWQNFANGQGVSISEAKKRADEMDVKAFANKAKKYVEEKDFSHQANQVLKLYNLTMRVNRLELLKANIGLELIAVFDDLDKYFSKSLTGAALTEFERQSGILGLSVPKNGYNSLVESVLNGSYKVEGFASFSDKLWQYQFELKADIEKLLIRSVTGGINPKALAPQLKRLMTEQGKLNATYNAQRLLVSETTRIQTAIQEESYKKADIEEYEYIAEPSACPICGALNGKIFKVKDMSPGINAPNMHPFCRCSTAPHVDDKAFWDDRLKEQSNKNSDNNIPVSLKGLNDDYLNEKREESRLKAGRVNAKKYDAQSESFAKLTNEASMRMRISDIGFRRAIESGNLKSSHELGDDFAKGRIRIEKTLFNLPENIKRSEMPKYGYLSDSDDLFEKKARHSVLGYGDITIEFDDSVRKRTTYTVNDSLVNKRGLITSATPVGTKPTYNGIKEKAIGEINSISEFLNSNKKTNRYIEAQYHGDLTFKNDVKRIIVPDKSYLDKFSKEFEQLKNMGIEVLVTPK